MQLSYRLPATHTNFLLNCQMQAIFHKIWCERIIPNIGQLKCLLSFMMKSKAKITLRQNLNSGLTLLCQFLYKQVHYILTSLSVDDLLSTPGKLTLVSQPRPLQNRRIELANFAGASSTTFPTPSTFRRLVRVLKNKNKQTYNSFRQIQNTLR